MEKEFRIKDYFEGSDSQLKYLGKQASKLYRSIYGTEPNKIEVENELWGYENIYPVSVLEQLEKPVKKIVTDVYCYPVVQKSTEEKPIVHGWDCKYKEYNEYIIKHYSGIKGVLKSPPYIKKDGTISSPYSYNFDLIDKNITLHIKMRDNSYTRKIISVVNMCSLDTNIKIQIVTGENGWPILKINDGIIKTNFKQEELFKKIIIMENDNI